MQRRLLAGGMSSAVAPSSKEPLLVQRVQRKEVFLIAADLAVVPAGLGILQRSWSVFSSRGENLCECGIDGNKFDWLGVGARSLLEASGETLKNGWKGAEWEGSCGHRLPGPRIVFGGVTHNLCIPRAWHCSWSLMEDADTPYISTSTRHLWRAAFFCRGRWLCSATGSTDWTDLVHFMYG